MHSNTGSIGVRSWLGGNARYERLLFAAVLFPLSAHVDFAANDGTSLASVFAQDVDRRLSIPESEQRTYAELLVENLEALDCTEAQYVLIVDRNKFVQAAMIYWMSPDRIFHFIGASPFPPANQGDSTTLLLRPESSSIRLPTWTFSRKALPINLEFAVTGARACGCMTSVGRRPRRDGTVAVKANCRSKCMPQIPTC